MRPIRAGQRVLVLLLAICALAPTLAGLRARAAAPWAAGSVAGIVRTRSGDGGEGVAVVSSRHLDARVAAARAAIVVSYELPAAGGMTAALERVCQSGGRGDVILAGADFIVGESVRAVDDRAQVALEGAGCHVQRSRVPLHLKLAFITIGGAEEAYLADRNFGRYATIVRITSAADRDLIAATLRNQPGSNGTLATLKGLALQIEAQTIVQSSGHVDVESESFGPSTPVYNAILSRRCKVVAYG